MRFRFGSFVLDEECRELRLDGHEVEVQPLVFDLLCYLVHNRDRVVTKQELLDALWDDALVVDGALQRVVSLARTALKQGGSEKSIRTYARHGYRFCGEAVAEIDVAADAEPLGRARATFENKDWEAAITAFAAADAASELDGADLERWARALQCLGLSADAVAPLERAVATYALTGDRRGSARAALSMAHVFIERREPAVAQGWHQRAGRYLADMEPCVEHAMLAQIASRLALYARDNERALACGNEAIEIARRLNNADLEAMGLVYSGHALLAMGDIAGGTARQNEAAAAVLAGEISPWYVGIIYCGVVFACRNLGDWKRAAEWTEHFTRWCQTRAGARFPSTCQLHRAEVLTFRGDLEAAESEITAALALLSTNAPWAEGDAHRIRGNLLLLRGDLEGAGRAFALAIEQGWDPQPEYALFLDARHETERAVRSLERSIADNSWCNRERMPELLSALVTLCARHGDETRARAAMAELDGLAERLTMPAQQAVVEQARGELAAATAQRAVALSSLRRALRLWEEVHAPIRAAGTRVRLAELLLEDGDPGAARAELSAASRTAHALGLSALIGTCAELEARSRPA